jgi:O-methyltransferase involved in polyketide biosynthesis
MAVESKLTGVPETLLIPLWARAAETREPDPIVRDEQAAEILAPIDYDFSKFQKARMSQLGVAVRTVLLDGATRSFLEKNPGACVINLGAGLDTRHARLRPGAVLWYELDLPEAMALRGQFFQETDTYRFLRASVFDEKWMSEIETGDRPVLLIAEGLLMYFAEEELRPLFRRLVARFPGAEMLVEVQGPGIVGQARRHDSLRRMENAPEFKWGTADSTDLVRWDPDIELLDEWSFFDHHLDRAGWIAWLVRIPLVRRKYEPRIVHLRFRDCRNAALLGRGASVTGSSS